MYYGGAPCEARRGSDKRIHFQGSYNSSQFHGRRFSGRGQHVYQLKGQSSRLVHDSLQTSGRGCHGGSDNLPQGLGVIEVVLIATKLGTMLEISPAQGFSTSM